MGPKGFLFFETYWNLMEDLSDQRFGAFVKAACRYVFNGIEPTFKDKKLNALWGVVTPSLNNSIKRSKAGTKGMESRYNKTPNEKEKEKEKEEEKEEEKKEEKKKEEKKDSLSLTREEDFFEEKKDSSSSDAEEVAFRPPTVEEVEAYCKEQGFTFSAANFVSSNESKGWYIGPTPMRSWKAAARSWQEKESLFHTPKTIKPNQNVRNERPYISDAQRAKAARDAEFAAYAQRLLNTPDEKPELPF